MPLVIVENVILIFIIISYYNLIGLYYACNLMPVTRGEPKATELGQSILFRAPFCKILSWNISESSGDSGENVRIPS